MAPTPASLAAVSEAFAALPPRHRQALMLSRAGMTFLEVADRLGEPVEQIRSQVLQSVVALTAARLAVVPS